MSDNFGVSRGAERVAFVEQFFFKRQIVFDDAVMRERQNGRIGRAAEMGMGVRLTWRAVGRPASVADAGRARKRRRGDVLGERVNPANGFGDVETAIG